MNKRFVGVALLLMLCLLALTGCSAIKGLEKDLQVVLEVNGEYYDCVTVNSFNNAVVKEPQAPEGLIFRGWTVQESWTEEEAATVPVIDNTGLVRYNDVKDAAAKNALSVTLRAVFTTPPKRDLVIAWYAKESTSGLNAGHMEGFQEKLYAYLTSQGYKPEEMDIVIRPYEGGVADTCAAINKDADVDITVGWSSTSNLTSTGGWVEGVDFVENVSGVTIGAKSRYTARISGTDLSLLVYAWIQNEYGQGVNAAPAVQEQPAAQAPAVVVDDGKLVIGWYAKSATSGLDEATIARFEEVLRAQLTAAGYTQELVIRPYDGVVADVQAAVLADGDVDLMVGMKAFVLEGIEMEAHEDVAMGEKTGRRLHRISNEEIAINVFEWLKAEAANGLFLADYTAPVTVLTPAAPVTPAVVDDGKLVIGWYAKSATSGLDEATVVRFEEVLRAQLTAAGYTQELVIRPYDGVVDEVQAAVAADGDVDLMIGMKKFALEGVEMDVQNDVAMGEKTDRRIHRISNEEIAINVFEWLKAEAANGLFLADYTAPVTTLAPSSQAPAVVDDGKLVIGWYAKSATSGLDEATVARFEEGLKAYLAANGCTQELVIRPYDGVVDEVQAAVTADGDVDLMIGMKKFALEGVEMDVQNDVAMGEKTDRRIHRISNEEIAINVFEWLKTEEARNLFVAQ